jgi:dihydrofolate synthase/folylpolyglutamate synthase
MSGFAGRQRALCGAEPLQTLGFPSLLLPAPVPPALPGPHQLANAALAVALSQQAAFALGHSLDDVTVRRGLVKVRWPGRLERIADDVLLDCAHNVEGATALATALPETPRRVLVTSIVRDKNAAGMLAVLAPACSRG